MQASALMTGTHAHAQALTASVPVGEVAKIASADFDNPEA